MTRTRIGIALTVCLLAATPYSLRADVRADEKSKVAFGGMLGKMMNLFGGKAAKEGVTSTVAVKGDRMVTLGDTTGQIVDLNEEKIYDLDMRKKTYKVTTFAELRRKMEEARKKAEEDARKAAAQEAKEKKAEPTPAPDKNQKEIEVDFDLKDTGQKKTINGFDTHEVVMTITMREKGRKLEESGGMVLTNDMWLAPRLVAMKEIADFHMRYARKLEGPMVAGASAEDMAAAMALYPMMRDALARMNTENVKMDGTAILTTMTMDAVKSADQVAEEQKQAQEESKPKASGGLSGMLARAAAKKVAGPSDAGNPRATVMTMNHEYLKVTTDVSAAELAIPAGFKENK